MERKTLVNAEIKAGSAETGTFQGLASVYNVVDRQGDVVLPGAFTKSIAENGGEIPLLYQHRQDWSVGLGKLIDTEIGLALDGKLALGVHEADQSWKRMQAGILKSMSIGYDVTLSSFKDGVRQLQEIKLWEVSLVTIPANPLAGILGMKSYEDVVGEMAEMVHLVTREVKAGRVLSGRNIGLVKQAMEALAALIQAAENAPPAEDETEKARKAEELAALVDYQTLLTNAATLAAKVKQ
jgi:HK97 family phage prohead protease